MLVHVNPHKALHATVCVLPHPALHATDITKGSDPLMLMLISFSSFLSLVERLGEEVVAFKVAHCCRYVPLSTWSQVLHRICELA